MATYGGQNVGARRLDRIGAGLKLCSSGNCLLRNLSGSDFTLGKEYLLPVCEQGGDGDCSGYLSVPGLKRSVLFPSFSGEQYPFPDSGNGIQYICGNSRSL